ncbi:hypothetical protein M378DRAFT_162995 [Amanita muscaria Koide BX008]|uniref:Uncharacterized protein n=1 Tax=Amanita muscaria (strain Koide BX008) TaxID=946122 RepID=A0A0C2SMV9_AMAMK|nr:hypothetical protein M378DRAFT_162995 [Amanita muscaria Koide BX008]
MHPRPPSTPSTRTARQPRLVKNNHVLPYNENDATVLFYVEGDQDECATSWE